MVSTPPCLFSSSMPFFLFFIFYFILIAFNVTSISIYNCERSYCGRFFACSSRTKGYLSLRVRFRRKSRIKTILTIQLQCTMQAEVQIPLSLKNGLSYEDRIVFRADNRHQHIPAIPIAALTAITFVGPPSKYYNGIIAEVPQRRQSPFSIETCFALVVYIAICRYLVVSEMLNTISALSPERPSFSTHSLPKQSSVIVLPL